MIELGARLTRCQHFRWMPGMTVRNSVDQGVVTSCWYPQYHEDGRPKGRPSHVWVQFDEECRAHDIAEAGSGDWYPDLTDPATVGCLLALVRDARGAVIVRPPEDPPQVTGWWEVEALPDGPAWGGWTEAEALVAALEEA